MIPYSFRSATPNAFSYTGDGDSSFLSNTGTLNYTVSNLKQILNTHNCRNIKSYKVNARLSNLMCKGGGGGKMGHKKRKVGYSEVHFLTCYLAYRCKARKPNNQTKAMFTHKNKTYVVQFTIY